MPELKIKPVLELGQIVTLKTDPEKYDRIVVAIHITFNGLMYELGCMDEVTSVHFIIEIDTPDKK
jgi:lipopolysaccharide biosynthesis protein